ncbi:hypothetical protein VIGAN_09171400 [Vigna angularis var. angularis]|uniref:Secreted protein n=1 Tax=Vigna angularis var. angularis TaxID=157739 RepID=A0A0S3SZ25_PHAAN|nr:hypothetical protein VIGAN_09171400 [Vigna angularis var. angularis]
MGLALIFLLIQLHLVVCTQQIHEYAEVRTCGTRFASLGGSDVEIPCVSWIRRSRPRKDMTSLMVCDTVSCLYVRLTPLTKA